jgi:retron-type reverse transcriptase
LASNYWSSTTNANNTDNAWIMNFNNGNDNNNNKSNNNYVRAVRGGKCSLLSFAAVHRAYLDCRKRKRGTINALKFEVDALGNLFDLALDLQKNRYRPSRSVCFITRSPKLREIFAADFRDRIVHHLMVRELEKVWEPRFIHDSYASRKGKGIHGAVQRLQSFMRKAGKSGKQRAWFLQLDIRSFFMSIDKAVLFDMFKNDPKCPAEILNLLSIVIFHDPTSDYTFKGDPSMLKRVPAHKSLFGVGPAKGLPIGNLTSQFFSNVYLNELDQYVKHHLRCCHYLRYVDDFILVSAGQEELMCWQEKIAAFIADRLKLRLKEQNRPKPVSEGADFLGYIVRPGYILARRRVVNNLKYKLARFREEFVPSSKANQGAGRKAKEKRRPAQGEKRLIVDPDRALALQQVLASYLGHFRHGNCHRLVRHLVSRNPWLAQLYDLKEGTPAPKAVPARAFKTMRTQVGFFRQRYPDRVLLFKLGRFVEAYGADALFIHWLRGFTLMRRHRGMQISAGFPARMAPGIRNRLLASGKKTVMLAEGPLTGGVRQRYVRELMWPAMKPKTGEVR